VNALNSIIIEGNIVGDPVTKETTRGSTVTNFQIASNRFFRNGDNTEQETSFFEIEAWGKLAEVCAEICEKGRGIRVVGRLKQDRWTDAEGRACSKVKVVAEHVEFRHMYTQKPEADEAPEA
jgi:single-strand DNA-binding protein